MTRPTPDLKTLSTDDLLQGLEDRDFRPQNIIEIWLKSAGYIPGTTPIKATELFDIFRDWYGVRPELATYEMPTQYAFGLEMASRFRRERKKAGNYYYVQRAVDSESQK